MIRDQKKLRRWLYRVLPATFPAFYAARRRGLDHGATGNGRYPVAELQKKYQDQINQALQKDGGKSGASVEALLKKIQAELDAQVKQQVRESFDFSDESLLNEGPLDMAMSRAAGAIRRGKEIMGNVPQQDAKSSAQHAIIKRFEMMQKRVESDLRELERDLTTTSGTDTRVKDAVTNTIAQIGAKHGFTPRQSKFQDFRHGAGKLVQNVATGALLALPIVAAAGPIAAAIGLTGAGAAAATAGVSAGSVSMLKDLIDGQKVNGKKAVFAAITAAATAGLFKWAMDNWMQPNVNPQAPVENPTAPAISDHQKNIENTVHNFSKEHGPSGLNLQSQMDWRKVGVGTALRDLGIGGAPGKTSNIVQNFITDELGPKGTKKVMDFIMNMDPQAREQMFSQANRKSGAAIKQLAQEIGSPAVQKAAKVFLKGYR